MKTQDGNDSKAVRSAYIWNTIGSILNAFQSVVMLMVITRVCGMTTAGVFTFAYANANLFLTLGCFGMRNFEASDVGPKYSFKAYARSRIVTCVAMVLCSWLWLAWSANANGYGWDKTMAVALMTLMKGTDAVEDVCDGAYQQSGRLDIAGKLLTFRVASTIGVFCFVILRTGDLVHATLGGFVWTIAVLVIGITFILKTQSLPHAHDEAPVGSALALLIECTPLFLASFLLFYVGNAPKYAIDALLGDAEQAVYGFIAMPVFVVGLLAQFVYAPLVQPMSGMWMAGNRRSFARTMLRQIGIICVISLACVLAAAIAGPPVLSALYACDLGPWRGQLCVLVAGGGLLALASLFTMGVTIMRAQRRLVVGYAFVAFAALLLSGPLVRAWGINGAVVCYVSCMVMLAGWFGYEFVRKLREPER